MMMFFTGTVLLVIGLLAKLLDAWLRKSEKERLSEKVTGIWLRIDNASPSAVYQAPLRVFSAILDTMLGDKVFTGKALWRTAVISLVITVFALSLGGLIIKAPFAFKRPPWKTFDTQILILQRLSNSFDELARSKADLIERTGMRDALKWQKNFNLALAKHNTTGYKIIFSVLTIVFMLLIITAIYVISVGISRLMIREAMEANTNLLMISILFLNLCIEAVLALIAVLVLFAVAFPSLLLSNIYMIPFLLMRMQNLLLLSSIFTFWVGLFWPIIFPVWSDILAAVATLPMILLVAVLFISSLLFPFRKQIRYLLCQGLLRALEHEKGIFMVVSIVCACIGGIAVVIAKMF